MWAVYLCGCTDCFLHALFVEEAKAIEWAKAHDINPEGYYIKFYKNPEDIPNEDTGWKRENTECQHDDYYSAGLVEAKECAQCNKLFL